jgi:glycerophosphoryl diester phosphodiesterase
MKIMAHRGIWLDKSEQNTVKAFNRALRFNCRIELDVRDYRGDIVVSQDIAGPSNAIIRLISRIT